MVLSSKRQLRKERQEHEYMNNMTFLYLTLKYLPNYTEVKLRAELHQCLMEDLINESVCIKYETC